jgi:hypothetical protein
MRAFFEGLLQEILTFVGSSPLAAFSCLVHS